MIAIPHSLKDYLLIQMDVYVYPSQTQAFPSYLQSQKWASSKPSSSPTPSRRLGNRALPKRLRLTRTTRLRPSSLQATIIRRLCRLQRRQRHILRASSVVQWQLRDSAAAEEPSLPVAQHNITSNRVSSQADLFRSKRPAAPTRTVSVVWIRHRRMRLGALLVRARNFPARLLGRRGSSRDLDVYVGGFEIYGLDAFGV